MYDRVLLTLEAQHAQRLAALSEVECASEGDQAAAEAGLNTTYSTLLHNFENRHYGHPH